jgi:hypothetical protein
VAPRRARRAAVSASEARSEAESAEPSGVNAVASEARSEARNSPHAAPPRDPLIAHFHEGLAFAHFARALSNLQASFARACATPELIASYSDALARGSWS